MTAVAVAVAVAILIGCAFGVRQIARAEAALGDDVCTWTCPRCDHSRPDATCTCQGDCGRDGCIWPMWQARLASQSFRDEMDGLLKGQRRG